MPQFTDDEGNVWEATGPDDPNPRFVSGPNAGRILTNPTAEAKENRAETAEERAQRGEYFDRDDRTFDEADKLRDEYRQLPGVVEYNVALGTYNSAQNTKPSAQGDQSLITAYAKMLDPNSVVREGEFAVTASTESTLNQLKSRLAKELGWKEGGMLTEDGRTAIRGEMLNLVTNRFKPAYERDRQQYQRFAQLNGLDPFMVVGERAETGFPPDLLSAPEVPQNEYTPATGDTRADKIPPEYQQAHSAYLQENWGHIDPEDYAVFRSKLDEQYGLTPNPVEYRKAVPSFNEAAQQGATPAQLGAVPDPQVQMSGLESRINQAAQSNEGTFYANLGNSLAAGLPARFTGNQENLEVLRGLNPGAALGGDIVGGTAGAVGTGGTLGAISGGLRAGRASSLLGNPLTGDIAHSTIYGATQDTENPFRGGAIGAGGATLGHFGGRVVGGAFPNRFARNAIEEADASVPTTQELKDLASRQYSEAEAAGEIAAPNATQELLGQFNAILAREGRMTPVGRLIDTDTPTNKAHTLINDFAGQQMSPTQAGSVRKVLGEGLISKEPAQRRMSGQLIDQFDQWAEPVLPGVDKARETASRYLQAEEIETALALARANGSQFTRSGEENALRNAFRNIERSTIRGNRRFDQNVNRAINRVGEGTPLANAARNLGKYAPTSPMAMMAGGGGVGALAGGMFGGGVGAAAGLLTAGAGSAGRKVATDQARRNAEIALLTARGGPEYEALLAEAVDTARKRAGRFGGALFGSGAAVANRETY